MFTSIASRRVKRACAVTMAVACMHFSAASIAGNEIHRCSDSEGVTYTDRGCGAQAQTVLFTVASASPSGLQPAVYRELPVTLGMSPRSVFDALGRPVETIATLQGRRLIEYWLYRSAAGGVTRVAFQEGRVSSVQAR